MRHPRPFLTLVVALSVSLLSAVAASRGSDPGAQVELRVAVAAGDVGAPGRYEVRVLVSTTALRDAVSVRVGSDTPHTVRVRRRSPGTLTVSRYLTGGTLVVTATGQRTRPRLRVDVRRLPTASGGQRTPTISTLTLGPTAGSSVGTEHETQLPSSAGGQPAGGSQPAKGQPAAPVVEGSGTSPSGAATGPSGDAGSPAGGGVATYDRLVWSDEFDGPAGSPPDSADWTFDVGAWGASAGELETYTDDPANVSLDGEGHLAITALRRTATGPDGVPRDYTSGRIETAGLFSFTYGRVEASMKVPTGRGIWPAFWMLGEDIDTVGWPASGEIDVMELLGQDPQTVYGTVHGPVSGSTSAYQVQGRVVSAQSLADAFHVYGVIWQPGKITWTLDGVPYATVTPSDLAPREQWVFDGQPFHLVLNLAVGGDWPGAPDASTPFPSTLLVDWVRVYQ